MSIASVIIISIKPEYAEKIFSGDKTVELRRVRPKRLEKGSLALVYVSSPVKALAGIFEVDSILEKPLDNLWADVQHRAGISKKDFNAYYKDATEGIGICLKNATRLSKPIDLETLKKSRKPFVPPQSFRYATKEEAHFAKM